MKTDRNRQKKIEKQIKQIKQMKTDKQVGWGT